MRWLDWYGCYEESNRPWYVPEAFTHPAKMAIGLCRRIFEFMEERGAIKRGDWIVDPFGGIGTTPLIGTAKGYRCIAVELEEKFIRLTNANIGKQRRIFEATNSMMPIIIQGDSRKLSELIPMADSIVTSSPYGTTKGGGAKGIAVRGYQKRGKEKVEKQIVDRQYTQEHFSDENISNLPDGSINAVIASPPYADQQLQGSAAIGWKYLKLAKEGKIDEAVHLYRKEVMDRLPKHDRWTDENIRKHIERAGVKGYDGVSAIVTSPAYSNISTGAGGLNTKPPKKAGQQTGRSSSAPSQKTDQKYGATEGQIARLKDKGVDAAITSPPFEDSLGSDDPKKRGGLFRDPKRSGDKNLTGTYGKTAGQIGKDKGETYWQAMRQVYIECWKILKKDGWIAIVVKDYVRKKQRVPLCDNTVKLLENVGFVVEYRVRAWTLTETIHHDLFKGEIVNKKERKSFFRRLQEQKGSPRIDWEEIIFARRK